MRERPYFAAQRSNIQQLMLAPNSPMSAQMLTGVRFGVLNPRLRSAESVPCPAAVRTAVQMPNLEDLRLGRFVPSPHQPPPALQNTPVNPRSPPLVLKRGVRVPRAPQIKMQHGCFI